MIDSSSSYPFPVLGIDRMDYTGCCRYTTSNWQIKDDTVNCRHEIIGNSMISRLIAEGKACFGCIVVMKTTMYRKTFIVTDNKEMSVEQKIPIQKTNRSIELPKFIPMIIYQGTKQVITGSTEEGLDKFWEGKTFTLLKGSILAIDQGHQCEPSIGHLMKVKAAEELNPGEIKVEIIEADGGYFLVYMAKDLFAGFRQVKTQDKDKLYHCHSIMTHALSVGFNMLATENIDESNYKNLENFQSVKRHLKEKDINTWDDGEFDACEAACVYLPHYLGQTESEDDES